MLPQHTPTPPNHQPDPWHQPIATWADHLAARGLAPTSITNYRGFIARFAQAHPHTDPWHITGQQIAAHFINHPAWKPRTRKQAAKALNLFYCWAIDMGHTTHNPTKALGRIRVPTGVPRPVDDALFTEALANATGPVRLALLLGAHAGLRRHEIAKVAREDVTDAGLHVQGKGAKTRIVPLTPELRAELLAHPPGWVFPAIRPRKTSPPGGHIHHDTIAKWIAKALGGHATPHQLRHRFGTKAYAGTRDLRAVQVVMGHANISTTAIYVAVSDDSLHAAVMAAAG